MPRANGGPRLVLYGPDTKYGAKRKSGFKRYVWYIVWSEKGQKREIPTDVERINGSDVERISADRALERYLTERREQAESAAAPAGPRHPNVFKIAEALTFYADERATKAADPERIGYAIKALASFWGESTVSEINDTTCDEYGEFRAEEFTVKEALRVQKAIEAGSPVKPMRDLSPATVRREMGTLQAALTYCVDSQYLQSAPSVPLPPKSPARQRWLTRSEVARLLWASRKVKRSYRYLPLFILLGVYHGPRRRALSALQWLPNTVGGYVNMHRYRIDFQGGARLTNKRRVEVPINRRCLTFLRYARQKTNGHYVIEYQGGSVDNPNRALQAAATLAGLGKVTAHTLRHTAISWLVQEGVPLWEVSHWVGVSTEQIERTYGHHSPDRFKNVQRAHR